MSEEAHDVLGDEQDHDHKPIRRKGGWPKGKKRKSHGPAKVMPFKAPDEFAGMTANTCCGACNVDKCAITRLALCGHPLKGGLQPAQLLVPDIVQRFERAKKALAHQKIDTRET